MHIMTVMAAPGPLYWYP